VHRQRAYVSGGLQPGAALVVVRLAIVTLPPRSTAPAVAGCLLVGCGVVRGRPLRSRASASAWGPFWTPVTRPLLLPLRPPSGGGVGFQLRGAVWEE
jgi:hypothetical protein